MRVILLLFLGLPLSARAQLSCGDYFKKPTPTSPVLSVAVQAQILKLNPELLTPEPSLEAQYLKLRENEIHWMTTKDVFPESLRDRLHENYSEHFNLPSGPEGLRLFYLNTLNSLYSRVAWEWKKVTAENMIGEKLSGDVLKTAQALMDSFFPYSSMAAYGITRERSQEFFELKEWLSYPFKDAIVIAKAWHTTAIGLPAYQFADWHSRQTGLPEMASVNLDRLSTALGKTPKPVDCCNAINACIECPTNRALLKK